MQLNEESLMNLTMQVFEDLGIENPSYSELASIQTILEYTYNLGIKDSQ